MGKYVRGTYVDTSSEKPVALIEKITEKTRQGRIVWQVTETGMSCSIDNRMEISFVRVPRALPGGSGWDLFTVREATGTEILRVERFRSRPALPPVPGTAEEAILAAADRLYEEIMAAKGSRVDKAIEIIDSV
jgi:hypothetical protein